MRELESPPIPLSRHVPGPSNLWIDAAPHWAGRTDEPWIDLRSLDLGGVAGLVKGLTWRTRALPRSIYLPPLGSDAAADAAALVAWCTGTGIIFVEHVLPQSFQPSDPPAGARVFDLLGVLLDRELEQLASVPPGSVFSWPLLAGLTDAPELIEDGVERLARGGASTVIPLLPTLSPAARRHLSEAHAPQVFETVFHAEAADPRPLAVACLRHGIEFLPRRPTGPGTEAHRLERRVAAELGLIAELWVRAGGTEPRAHAFYRAARWFETTSHDAYDLWRAGNLGVIPWMDAEIEAVIADLAGGAERSALLATARERWANPS